VRFADGACKIRIIIYARGERTSGHEREHRIPSGHDDDGGPRLTKEHKFAINDIIIYYTHTYTDDESEKRIRRRDRARRKTKTKRDATTLQ